LRFTAILAHQGRRDRRGGVSFAGAMAVAMTVDALLGWPGALFARIGHPVTWIGRLISLLDRSWNRSAAAPAIRRIAGVAAALSVIGLCVALGWIVQAVLSPRWGSAMILGTLAWPMVALRSLYDHVAAVAQPLQSGDIDAARLAVAQIVGRDPTTLDEAGIARAAIESLAENASDGIVAPVFWGALFGLPGIFGYKAINTLDSMIGHRSERHLYFGWAAARIDDVANFIPARLTGFLFGLVSVRFPKALFCMVRDANRHRSINAGWPEAAMAGALGVRLSGPRSYHGSMTEEPWLNERACDPLAADISQGLWLYIRAMALLGASLVALALA
jgi:adenosylcobinamide-phosphate synthase